jgi:hypothetical protein
VRWAFFLSNPREEIAMATPNRKQGTKRAPAQKSNRLPREARRVDRAARRERAATDKQELDDGVVDRDFDAPAEEIEIDPQLDENGSAEP